VTVFPVSAPSSQDESGGASAQAPAKATKEQLAAADAGEGKDRRSFWDRFRLAQVDQGKAASEATVEQKVEQVPKKKPVILEEVIVTGSRIPTTAKEGPQPVRVYTREQIDQSGQVTLADFLNTLPDVPRASPESSFGNNFAGRTTVNIHGLPQGTSLLLINGRRLETSGGGGAGGAYFDLGNIPLAAIERIDMMPVGASAIYGSDALAGAVNIIPQKGL